MSKRLGEIIGCKYKTCFSHSAYWLPTHRRTIEPRAKPSNKTKIYIHRALRMYYRRTETTCATPTFIARRHVDASRDFFSLSFFSELAARGGGGGGVAARHFFFFFPVQQTTSGIGHRVKYFFRVGNQCAECEKQQQQLATFRFFFKQQLATTTGNNNWTLFCPTIFVEYRYLL